MAAYVLASRHESRNALVPCVVGSGFYAIRMLKPSITTRFPLIFSNFFLCFPLVFGSVLGPEVSLLVIFLRIARVTTIVFDALFGIFLAECGEEARHCSALGRQYAAERTRSLQHIFSWRYFSPPLPYLCFACVASYVVIGSGPGSSARCTEPLSFVQNQILPLLIRSFVSLGRCAARRGTERKT